MLVCLPEGKLEDAGRRIDNLESMVNNELVRDEAKRSIKNSAGLLGLNRLYTKYYRLTTNWPSTTVESPLQISSFMQNKANFLDALMNVTFLITADYENIANSKLCENKANTKPNKANLPDAQMNVSSFVTKEYENISNCSLAENKPNTKPIQTQTKPIQTQTKPIQTQTKPIQTQTKPISNYPCVFELAVYNLVLRYGNVMQSMPNGRNFDGEYIKWQMRQEQTQ